MDNTLVPLGARGASPRTLEAIHAAMDAGVLFGPSTGRDTVELMRLFRADESCFQTGVLSNGKRVRAQGKTVSLTLIPHDGLVAIARELEGTTMFLACYPAESNLLNPAYAVGAPSEEVLNRYEARVKFVGGMVDEVPDVDFVIPVASSSSWRPRALLTPCGMMSNQPGMGETMRSSGTFSATMRRASSICSGVRLRVSW